MSIIVYGPQGCGKSLNGEKLRRHFGMRSVLDADELVGPGLIYALIDNPRQAPRVKSLNAVILTNEPPPPGFDPRRAVSFEAAMKQINKRGTRRV